MSSLLDLVEADLNSEMSEVASDGDNFENDDDEISDEEGKNPSEPRKPRRAEIDPQTMTEEEREQLRARVIAQVEFYFGDHHYPNDQFLLDKAKEDPEGFLDIKYIMPFKKMRRLTTFPAFVAQCMRGSAAVGVNEAGNKLRRIAPVWSPALSCPAGSGLSSPHAHVVSAHLPCRFRRTSRMRCAAPC
jgi:hypothetical protein